ncbi:unnamed protein product, partial [Didymodactylos carnosus]
TGQAEGEKSDIYLKPVAIFRDPFISMGEVRVNPEQQHPEHPETNLTSFT